MGKHGMTKYTGCPGAGFTLVETLVVIAVVGAGSLAMMSLLEWSSRGARTVRAKNEANTLQQELQQTYSRRAVCSTLLAGHRIEGNRLITTEESRRAQLSLSSSRSWAVGQPIPGTPLRLEAFQFEGFSALPGTERQFLGHLRVTLREANGGSSVASEIRVPIVVHTLQSGQITECAGEEASPRRIITCEAEREVNSWGAHWKTRVYEFSAADCGGELPDSSYEGFLSSYGMWGGVATVSVLNPGQQIAFGDRTYLQGSERRTPGQITGPAITAFPSQEQQPGRYFFKVQYVQKSVLGASGGSTAAEQFLTSCHAGVSEMMYQWCCRIDRVTGETQCKESNGYNAQSGPPNNKWVIGSSRSPAVAPVWLNFPGPFAAELSAGNYTLSCTEGSQGGTNHFKGPTCCRTNSNTGATICKQATNSPYHGGAFSSNNTNTDGTPYVPPPPSPGVNTNAAPFSWGSTITAF